MKCLLVRVHPVENSLCRYLSVQAEEHLRKKGYELVVKDLYQDGFQPCLSQSERETYYSERFDVSQLEKDVEQLQWAESLVLVFPTWWFGFPAILKGWFDRVWAPGYAYNHASDLGAITPCLLNLKEVKVITTLGSPWWVDWFVMWQPVRRTLKIALLGACTRGCRFKMLSLYKSEKLSQPQLDRFVEKIKRVL